jgi:hypothetical protein
LFLGQEFRPFWLEKARDLARAFLMQTLLKVLPMNFLNSSSKSKRDDGGCFHHFGCFSTLTFFPLIVFGGTEVPIVYILLCRPSEDSLEGSAIPDGIPSKGLAVHCRLGRLLDSNPGLQFHNLVALPISTTAPTNEPPLLPTNEPPLLPPMSHHCS